MELHFPQLPFYLTVKKIVKDSTVQVIVESKIHIVQQYGLKATPFRYE